MLTMWQEIFGVAVSVLFTAFVASQFWRGPKEEGRAMGQYGDDFVRAEKPVMFWFSMTVWAIWLCLIGCAAVLALAGRLP